MEAENKVSVLQLILLNSGYWYLREGKSERALIFKDTKLVRAHLIQ
jgi:hypothetical protein